jgi:hypothetical protein
MMATVRLLFFCMVLLMVAAAYGKITAILHASSILMFTAIFLLFARRFAATFLPPNQLTDKILLRHAI